MNSRPISRMPFIHSKPLACKNKLRNQESNMYELQETVGSSYQLLPGKSHEPFVHPFKLNLYVKCNG